MDLNNIQQYPRAGFWRRALSNMLDLLVIWLPSGLLAAILFALSAGMIQSDAGGMSYCQVRTKELPQNLVPPPPENHTGANLCKITFFGYPTSIQLNVFKTDKVVTSQVTITKTDSQTYMLNQAGDPVNGVSTDWLTSFAWIVYIIAFQMRRGATIGDRIAKITLHEVKNPEKTGVSFSKTLIRFFAQYIGLIPFVLVMLYFLVTQTFEAAFQQYPAVFFICWLIAFAWGITNLVLIVRKRDPLYDRIAGTTILRDERPDPHVL